jgi:hypothetical protein
LKVGEAVNLKEYPDYSGPDEEKCWTGILTEVKRFYVSMALFKVKEDEIDSLLTLPYELTRCCQM